MKGFRMRGVKSLERKLRGGYVQGMGSELRRGMRTATSIVESAAKGNLTPAHVASGQLRAGVGSRVEGTGLALKGIVGTKVEYGPYLEFGTRPHWPPFAPILKWVRLKGMGGADVARRVQVGIARHGTRKHPWLMPAFKENRARIVRILGRSVKAGLRKAK